MKRIAYYTGFTIATFGDIAIVLYAIYLFCYHAFGDVLWH